MTQVELDKEMKQLNEEMRKEYAEVDNLLAENHRQRNLTNAQIRALRGVIDHLKEQAHDLNNRTKDIARKYHELRRQKFVEFRGYKDAQIE